MGAVTDGKVQLGSGGLDVVAATDVEVQLCSRCLVLEAAAEVDVQLGSGGQVVEAAAEVDVQLGRRTCPNYSKNLIHFPFSCNTFVFPIDGALLLTH